MGNIIFPQYVPVFAGILEVFEASGKFLSQFPELEPPGEARIELPAMDRGVEKTDRARDAKAACDTPDDRFVLDAEGNLPLTTMLMSRLVFCTSSFFR